MRTKCLGKRICCGVIACVCLWAVIPAIADAQTSTSGVSITRKGRLPTFDTAILRSGMAWLDEDTEAFRLARQAMVPLLQNLGVSLITVKKTAVDVLPSAVPLPPDKTKDVVVGSPQKPSSKAGDTEKAKEKSRELAKTGKLPTVKLEGYSSVMKDTELPATVHNVRRVDVDTLLFAQSQQRGVPIMRKGGAIPGRVPLELLRDDRDSARYAFVIRFAMVQPATRGSGSMSVGGGSTAGVSGVSALGMGTPAPAGGSAPQADASAYARGYMGSAPGQDFWNRDADVRSPAYAERLRGTAQVATPPVSTAGKSGISGSAGTAAVLAQSSVASGSASIPTGAMLEIDCYDFSRATLGAMPPLVWQGVIHQQADGKELKDLLPGMIKLLLQEKK